MTTGRKLMRNFCFSRESDWQNLARWFGRYKFAAFSAPHRGWSVTGLCFIKCTSDQVLLSLVTDWQALSADGQAVFLWKRYRCLNAPQVFPPPWRLGSITKTFSHGGLTHFGVILTRLLFYFTDWTVCFGLPLLWMFFIRKPFRAG